ncbi:Uu.00g036130.m01.CDS01 [Anthostomella pinea]|uniref:EKC/KEOPS complex subunit CGI121 n=1 Tax=Anthostomella pinea TaxID=933095 RepID=A0AAI8YDH9_9PEZI|nr:Uu.00g036130.m01.CDS01 [Anthostomella pinea]
MKEPEKAPPAWLETIRLEHVPETHSVHVAVFKDIENAEFLHQQLLGRNADFEYAFIDASSVVSRLQVLSAIFKSITVQLNGAMKTPNIHSEIVSSLSPTKNISEAYRRYGITPTSKNIIVVRVLISPSTLTAEDVEKHLVDNVQGVSRPLDDKTLSGFTDWSKIRKYYKLNGVGWVDALKDVGVKSKEMEMLVLGGMSLRGL